MVTINDKIQIKTGCDGYRWATVERIENETYIMPVFIVRVLHGKHAGETIATTGYLGHAKPGQHIDHALPAIVNL